MPADLPQDIACRALHGGTAATVPVQEELHKHCEVQSECASAPDDPR